MTADFGNNPFVGLRPFESSESLLFFGRQEQTLELLDRLHQHHFVAVIGSSGSGKSSLIRAGLIPRLQAGYLVNDRDRWVIAMMKPGQTPICNLADVLLAEPALEITGLSSTDLEQKLKEEGADAVLHLLKPLWPKNANFFLLVDQFEELFRFALHQNNFEKKDEAKDFVNIMLALAEHKELPIYVVSTMRSDFIGDCSLIYGLPEAMNRSQYIVPRLTRLQLRNAIEGPVRLYRGRLNAGLTARLLNDAQLINDELPLLQHVLMRIWDYEETVSQNGELNLEDYESVGGIEKALSNHADEALQGMAPEELVITKKMFQALTTVDEMGRKIRRPARLSELESLTGAGRDQLLSLINRFVADNRSFLVVNNIPNSDDKLIDISHESLIRQWSTLSQWVDEETDSVRIFRRLTDTARLYQNRQGDLLTGNELQRVSEWFEKFGPNDAWAQHYSNEANNIFAFFHESRQQWQSVQKEKLRQQRRRQLNRRLLVAGLIGVILLISGFAYAIYRNNVKNKRQLAISYWSSSQAARSRGDVLGSLFFTAEAAILSDDENLAKNLLIDINPFLPQAGLQTIFSYQNLVLGAAFHPDNKHIAIAGNDSTVRVIDKETGTVVGRVMRHRAPVFSVAFSPDGKQLLSASNDNTARIWDAATGEALFILPHHDGVIGAVFSPGGKVVLTACADGYARLWDAASGKQTDSLKHRDAVTAVAFSPDGRSLLTGSNDSTAVLWEAATRKQLAIFRHRGSVSEVAFNADGQTLLTAGHDSTVQVWNSETKQSMATLQNGAEVNVALFSPDGNNILTADNSGLVKFWYAASGWPTGTPLKHDGPVYNMAFSADGQLVLTTGWDKTVRLWQLQDQTHNNKLVSFKHGAPLNSIVFNSDGTRVLSASDDSTAKIWDVKTGTVTVVLPHGVEVTKAVFSPDEKTVVTTGSDDMLRFWEVADARVKDSIALEGPLANVVFSRDGKKIATADGNRHIYFFDAGSRKILDSFTYATNVRSLAFSADAKSMLVGGWDSTTRLLTIATRKPTAVFKNKNVIGNAVFSPDGKKVLTASFDNTVRVWDPATQQQLGPAMQHDGGVKNAYFSPDGKWIVSTGFDDLVRLWDAATQEIRMRIKLESGLATAIFTPDGNTIVTAGNDGNIFFWEIAGDLDLSPDLFRLQARALTGAELNLATREVQCLPATEWKPLKKAYFEQGRDHYKTCRYTAYNLWRRFYAKEAEMVRTDVE